MPLDTFPTPAPEPTSGEADLRDALAQLARTQHTLGTQFPNEISEHNVYPLARWPGEPDGLNCSWTAGFWTGLLWMGAELGGPAPLADAARAQLPSYTLRLERRFVVDHHDLGFLYLPSCVAALRHGDDAAARSTALAAAELLMARYLPRAGVIQAWGRLDDAAQRGRIIIDCLLNLPLLHWATAQTGQQRFAAAARSHALRSQQVLVRDDATSFHTFHFDPDSGAPLGGTTQQGASDTSCWSRGQAWGLYGFALNHRWSPELGLLDTACRLAERFLADVPEHGVACWDLSLAGDPAEPWDSSASAIAACGLYEIAGQLEPHDAARAARYRREAERLLAGLLRHCAGWTAPGNALLRHGVYSRPEGLGVDEANLWGDFFFLEALARRARCWRPFWHPEPQR